VKCTGLYRTFRGAGATPSGSVAPEPAVDPAELAPLLDDFVERLLRLTAADPRSEIRAAFENPGSAKVVWRSSNGRVLGAAAATVEGRGADIAFMHILPKHAEVASTARLLDALLAALPPTVAKVRAMDRFAHRWLHLNPADTRALLEARDFVAFDRVLLTRDLVKPLPEVPALGPGYTLAVPNPANLDVYADFAFRAYRGTTDFGIITPDASLESYARLYRRFLTGELGPYAPALSAELRAPDGALAAVLHTILVGRDPYIGDLSVIEAHRRRGLGRFLLTRGLHAYRAAGHGGTALTVTAQNAAAYNLYRSLSFQVERSGQVFLLAR
jgi:GNAT superfamily N-acetyltransferase